MELWRKDLTLTPELISDNFGYKALVDGKVAGFTLITQPDHGFEVEHCFVLPEYIGKGCGSALLKHILALDRYRGAHFDVLADPNAVPFYAKFGFVTVGQVPSKPEGRTLPQMQMVNGEKR